MKKTLEQPSGFFWAIHVKKSDFQSPLHTEYFDILVLFLIKKLNY